MSAAFWRSNNFFLQRVGLISNRWFRVGCLGLLVLGSVQPLARGQEATLQFSIVDRAILEQRLASPPTRNRERRERLTALFEEAGCADLSLQEVRRSKLPNVVCILPGETDRNVLVGGHYDHTGDGHGIVDNWSGASLLVSLYESLSAAPRKHTFIFVGFADEERGLLGSRHYAKSLNPEEQERLEAVVNLDTLGLGPPKIWVSRSDDRLVRWLAAVASRMKIGIEGVNVEEVGSTDSESFRKRDIAVITIHSLTQETLKVIHSPKDRVQAIDKDAYFDTYQLLAAYLTLLDSGAPSDF